MTADQVTKLEPVFQELERAINQLRDCALLLGPTRKQREVMRLAENNAHAAVDLLRHYAKITTP